MSENAIKDFPMEGAMMSDMVALAVIEAMVSSDLSNLTHNSTDHCLIDAKTIITH